MKKHSKNFEDGMKMFRSEQIMDALEDAEAIVYPEYEDALIGHTQGYRIVAVYDYDMCVQILMERDGMSCLDAVEWMEFNTLGAHYGEKTPVFISTS